MYTEEDDGPPRYREARPPRHRRRGGEQNQVLLVIAVIAVMSGILSLQFSGNSQGTDRAAVDAVLHQVRQGLAAEISRRQAEPSSGEIAQLAGSNPFKLINARPDRYEGEVWNRANRPPAGHWYFDTRLHDMVYRVRDPHALETEGPYRDEVRLYLDLRYEDRNRNGRYDRDADAAHTIELQPRYAYRWLAERE